jgi:hypothetical protein
MPGGIETIPTYVTEAIGPRRVGDLYRDGYGGVVYRVVAIDLGSASRIFWSPWSITIVDVTGCIPGRVRTHCTPWDRGDSILLDTAEVTP